MIGSAVVSRDPLYRPYGPGKVLKTKGDQAKVEYVPHVFSAPPLFSHTKILRLERLEVLPPADQRLRAEDLGESCRFDLKQWAARFLTGNKGGQLGPSRTELLPHQIFTAHHVVAAARRRFMLADEVGLGKTIEAGMVWQALRQRGQADRALIICPAGLTLQWQEEMKDKFGQFFLIYGRDFTAINPRMWDIQTCAIASLDTLKHEDHKKKLLENRMWDLMIFDEAHRLSAREYRDKVDKTLNFQLAEDLKQYCEAMLLLTATPHQGEPDHSRFMNLMRLLDGEIDFSELSPELDLPLFRSLPRTGEMNGGRPYKDYILRTPKLSVTDAKGRKVFVGRDNHPLCFRMFGDEQDFYKAVTQYILSGYEAVDQLTDHKQRLALGFVLTIFQKLAASSSYAIRVALQGRKMRLQDRHRTAVMAQEREREREKRFDERYEGEYEEELSALRSEYEFIRDEINELERLINMPVKRDRKMVELCKLADRVFEESERGPVERILIFTEYRKTQAFIVEELELKYGKGCVVQINGDLDIDQRKVSQRRFREEDEVRFLVSTESGGEGINLQFCHVLVNYDLPWNPIRIEQRVGRIYRFGQKKRVQIYNFRNAGTVEEKVYGYMERRLDVAAEALAKVTGEDPEEIKSSILGSLDAELDYEKIYKRTLVEGTVRQSQKEIDDGLKKAERAFEIATQSLFRDVSSYSFDAYRRALESGLSLKDLEGFTSRFLYQHGRRVQKKGGALEFLAPEGLPGQNGKARYERVTFDREEAIRDSSLDFFAVGHEFVDRMLRHCGDPDFGGDTAVRVIKAAEHAGRRGIQLNFIVRSRIERDEGQDYLFDLETVFVDENGEADQALSRLCLESYSAEGTMPEIGALLPMLDRVLETAKQEVEERHPEIWDWDEDVTPLNVAVVVFE